MAVDRAFQMARAVAQVGAFAKQEAAGARIETESATGAGGAEQAVLHGVEFEIENALELLGEQRAEDDDLVEAVHEFGREFPAGGVDGGVLDFPVEGTAGLVSGRETEARLHQAVDFARAEVGGEEDHGLGEIDAAVVTEGERGLVEDAEQELPQGVGGLLDFVEEQQAELHAVGVIAGERFLGDERMRFAMAEIAGRRTDELGDLVRMLEFGAIHLDHRVRVTEEDFRGRFHHSRFPRAGGAEKKKIADRAAGRGEAGFVELEEIGDRGDGFLLPDDFLGKEIFEDLRFGAADCRIE